MEVKEKKTKTQLLKELQDVVDMFHEKKRNIDSLLIEIEDLERKYHLLRIEIKKNN